MTATTAPHANGQLSNKVFARWREHATLLDPIHSSPTLIHCYEAVALPPTPIRMGTRLRIIALSPRTYNWESEIPENPEYDTYDPYVDGAIVGMRGFKGSGEMEVVVENEIEGNKVAFAHITLSDKQSHDQRTGYGSGNSDHWIFHPMPAEPWPASPPDGSRIFDTTPPSPPKEVTLCFPDPRSNYATIIERTWGIRLKRRRDRRKELSKH